MESAETPEEQPKEPAKAPASEQETATSSSSSASNRRRRRRPRRPRARREAGPASASKDSPIGEAVAKVREIIQALGELQNDMEEVLDLLEKAEAEKTADEQAILSLRQELDKVQRGVVPRHAPRERSTATKSDRSERLP